MSSSQREYQHDEGSGERKASVLVHTPIREPSRQNSSREVTETPSDHVAPSPESPVPKTLQDYQLYLEMLEKAKAFEFSLEIEMQTRRRSLTRTRTGIERHSPRSSRGIDRWEPYHLSNAAAQPNNLIIQEYGSGQQDHGLANYQKQLFQLEEQNRMRMDLATHVVAELALLQPGSRKAIEPAPSVGGQDRLPSSNRTESRKISLRPRPCTRRSIT